jgi:hypothetical protein
MAIPEGLISYAWTALCAVLAPALFGAGVVRRLGLDPRQDRCAFAAWSYLVGQYVFAHVTFAWLWAGQPAPGWLLPVVAAVAGLALIGARPRGPLGEPSARPPAALRRARHAWPLAVALVFVGTALANQFLLAGLQPVTTGDEAVIWSAKAKVLYTAPGFELGFGLGYYVSHPDYPQFNPLVQVLAYASSGRILHFENRLPIQCFGVALVLLLASAAVRRIGPWAASAVVVAFTATAFFPTTAWAFADVMLACAMLATADAWLRWRETGARHWWRLACFGLAAALSSKNEGSLLAVAALAAAGCSALLQRRSARRRPLGRQWLWLAVPLAAVAAHQCFNAWFQCSNDLFDPNFGSGKGLLARIPGLLAERALPVAEYYGRMLVDPGTSRLLIVSMLAAAIARGRRCLGSDAAALVLFVLFGLGGYMLVFVGTYFDLQWHLGTAAHRTCLHVLPVAALGFCALMAPCAAAAPGKESDGAPAEA